MIIKKWNTTNSAWDALSPKVTYTDIVDDVTSATPSSIFISGKLKASYLPDFVFGGMQFEASIPTTVNYSGMADRLHAAYLEYGQDSLNGLKGKYFVAEGNFELLAPSTAQVKGSGTSNDPTKYYLYELETFDLEEEHPGGSGAADINLEHGDWLVITNVTGAGTSGDPYIFKFGVVNNTYQAATSSTAGVIRIGYTASGTNYALKLDASNKAYVTVPWENTTYTGGNGIGLSTTEFFVEAGVGLTQTTDGLKMSQPHISGTSTPGSTYQVADTIWFDLN